VFFTVNQLYRQYLVKNVIQTAGRGTQNVFETGVILLRNTTWKCGKVERLIINYLRTHLRHPKRSNPSMQEMLEHFISKGKKDTQVLDAVDRLENRRIIKLISNTNEELSENQE
jgi:hypothetical protein